jgi:hypothetical protein
VCSQTYSPSHQDLSPAILRKLKADIIDTHTQSIDKHDEIRCQSLNQQEVDGKHECPRSSHQRSFVGYMPQSEEKKTEV